jgi:ribosomal protein S18 acetylase RimI-like enzyme
MIRQATSADTERVRMLLREYADGLDVDLSFQNIDAELEDPLGVNELVLLSPGGFVALRKLDDDTCEMKRLYIREEARGGGLGRALAEAVIAHARARGYERMLLDTLPTMTVARTLYASLGFHETDAYRYNPVPGTSYLELDL